VLDDAVEEVPRGESLALKAALHVGEREQDGVDSPLLDLTPELV
jgi:hypothetical protein